MDINCMEKIDIGNYKMACENGAILYHTFASFKTSVLAATSIH